MDRKEFLRSKSVGVSVNNSVMDSEDSGRFYSYSGSSASFTNSITQTSRVPVQAYGATVQSIGGKSPKHVVLNEFDPFPVDMMCPNCHQTIQTKVKYKPGKLTFLSCGLVGVLSCGLGCCLIPFCINPLKDAYHSCPQCGSTIGVYQRKLDCS